MRLIDADALLNKLIKMPRYFTIKYDIEEAPTIDAVEVVRCKDCAWCRFDSIGTQCCFCGVKLLDSELRPDFYCGYGTRRSDG